MENPARSLSSWLARVFRRTPSYPTFRPEPQPLAPFEQALEEGLLIARHGVTLAVRNRLILRALRDNEPFADAATARMVEEELGDAAEEQRGNARMIGRSRASTGLSGGYADHAHDYHLIDAATLRRREELYLALARSLEEVRSDPPSVAAIGEEAREAAWRDIRENVEARLDRPTPRSDDPDYHLNRPEQLRLLLEVDLASLERRAHEQP